MKRILSLVFALTLSVPVFAQRTPVATDDFNRGTGIGASWSQLNNSIGGNIAICASIEYCGSTAGNMAVARWNGAGTFADDQYSSATYTDTTFGHQDYGIGVVCRASADTDANRDYYYHHAQSNDVSVFGEVNDGTNNTFHSAAVTWSDGDEVEIECEGDTIRAMKNGVALGGSFTVTGETSIASGKPGVTATGDSGVATGDDWVGGDLGAGAGGSPTKYRLTTLGVGGVFLFGGLEFLRRRKNKIARN